MTPDQTHHLNEGLTRVLYTRVLRVGDIAIDVGANRGDHSAEMARVVGPTGLVHAIEPNRTHLARLLAIAPNIVVWPFAAGERTQVADLYIPIHDDGWASLNDRREMLPNQQFTLHSVIEVQLDNVTEIASQSARISFIKIDVEDREIQAMRGLRRIIVAARPVLVFENLTSEISEFLSEVGYDLFDLYGRPYDREASPFANCLARDRNSSAHVVEATTIPQTVIDAEYATMKRLTEKPRRFWQ